MTCLYLCVDCGGTKTAAAVSDQHGNVVGRGTGGPSNITYLTVDEFITSVRMAILAALKDARRDIVELPVPRETESLFSAAWFGVSGADSPAAIAKVTPAISALLTIPVGPDLVVANDTHLLAAPVRMYPSINHAIAVIAGTGSITVSFKQEEGKIKELGRVGGWGWILGDEGGGYDVGREALRQLLMEEDLASVLGRPAPPSKLRDRILTKFNVPTVMEILGEVYHADPMGEITTHDLRSLSREKRISSLPPLVFVAAFEEDDWLAKRILQASAKQLADQVALHLRSGDGAATHGVRAQDAVISFGGSLVGNAKYRQIILDLLGERGHSFFQVHFIDDAAAVGATGLASSYKPSPV